MCCGPLLQYPIAFPFKNSGHQWPIWDRIKQESLEEPEGSKGKKLPGKYTNGYQAVKTSGIDTDCQYTN